MTRRLYYGTAISLFSIFLMLGAAPAPLQDVVANSQPTAPESTTSLTTTEPSHHHESGVPTGTQVIWCGLWNGSNFNFTDSCSHIGDNQPAHKPQQQATEAQTITTTTTPATESAPTATPMNTSTSDNDNDTATPSNTSTASSTSVTSMSQSSTTTTPSQPTNTSSTTSTTTQPAMSNSCTSTASTTTCGTQTVPTGTAVIWCGLWGGSNFDVSGDCENIGENQSTVTLPQSSGVQSTTASSSPATTISTSPPSNPQPMSGTYAALGDSVAAGLGLPLPVNADNNTTACGRSIQGYPNLVAANMGLPLQNFSCSGTTAGDLLTSETVNGVEQPPQLDQAFAHGTPKIISITAGANDIEWSFFLRQCHISNCADTTNTVAVDALLVTLQAKLHAVFSSIQHRSNGTPPTTIITGYYQPLSVQCAQQSVGQLSITEINWVQAATNALNQTIKQTADQYSFVRFVPVSFAGHDACSSNPWVQGLNSQAPFHPTAEGQQVIAQDVEAAMHQ